MGLSEFTLIVPFYRNVEMLKEQIKAWESYPDQVRIILVDDGSPEDAQTILLEHASLPLLRRVQLYRIDVDIPWNRGGARNLGAKLAETQWIVHVDIDHVLPPECALNLLRFEASPKHWYRFERYRRGTADETRRKDKIPPALAFGKIHPHVDSYLCTKRAFWETGGYDEDYSGCLGGGNPFLARMEAMFGVPGMVREDANLHVYTRSAVKDASDWALSRDSAEYSRRRRDKQARKDTTPHDPIRFPWTEILVSYPKVADEFETLGQLQLGKSIARFGDGEMKLITGAAQMREPANPKLGKELKQILQYSHPDCIVGIPTMDPRGPKYPNWRKHAARMATLVNHDVKYYSAFISRPDSAPWIEDKGYAAAMVDLWANKRIALVAENEEAKIHRLIKASAREPFVHIPCPHRETYAQIDSIMRAVVAAKPEIAVLSAGPAATCMANRLAGLGIHAIDVGSMGAFILRTLGAPDEDEPLESEE